MENMVLEKVEWLGQSWLPRPEESGYFKSVSSGCGPDRLCILPPALKGSGRAVEQLESVLAVRVMEIVADDVVGLRVDSF